MHNRLKDVTGKRFGKLLAVKFTSGTAASRGYWLCKCDCGTQKKITGGNLRSGRVKSCGCLNSEVSSLRYQTVNLSHGKTGTPEFSAWLMMKSRCSNANNHAYHHYGGRGITVCDRWAKFEAFLDDMGPRPTPAHSIDRINNDGSYEPGNCRWATRKEQANNRRTNRTLSMFGTSLTVSEWIDTGICGTGKNTLRSRLAGGWAPQLALLKPVAKEQL